MANLVTYCSITNNTVFSFTLPETGTLWEEAAIVELLLFLGVLVVPRWSGNGLSLVHSAGCLHKALLQGSPRLPMNLAAGTEHMHEAIEETERVAFPADPGIHGLWVQVALSKATERLALKHLRFLLSFVDHRGADVNLNTNMLRHRRRQPCPAPAAAAWRCVQWYGWRQPAHSNVLEITG